MKINEATEIVDQELATFPSTCVPVVKASYMAEFKVKGYEFLS